MGFGCANAFMCWFVSLYAVACAEMVNARNMIFYHTHSGSHTHYDALSGGLAL